MERAELKGYLDRGLSFEAIGRLVGRDPSTVAYWARRHGLKSPFADRHAPRGPIPKDKLAALVDRGTSIREMAAELDRSPGSVRHWLKQYGLIPLRAQRRAEMRAARSTGQRVILRDCAEHGLTEFILESRGFYRCTKCRWKRVARYRRRVKEILVAEAGGCCQLCGYRRYIGALQFHHIDPASKAFHVSREGVSRSLEKARAEARKCMLLCANCHAEVEGGVQALPFEAPALPG
jgi:transposase